MIHFTDSVASTLKSIFDSSKYDAVFVLCDENTRKHCFSLLNNPVPESNVIIIPAGEPYKTPASAQIIWKALAENRATRNSIMINLGGGMITDIGGFCASVYQRGMDFIHIPTSLLGMVDAAIGGKTGIDFLHLKNYIGTFSQPTEIIIDPVFLQTLGEEELRNGWAEVVKHGIISGGVLWELCRLPMPPKNAIGEWNEIIRQNVRMKQLIVDMDPMEKGPRKMLNLGHTIGHAIETAFLEAGKPVKHGFCVAAGIQIETIIAFLNHSIRKEIQEEINAVLRMHFDFLPLGTLSNDSLLHIIRADKKNTADQILLSIPQAPGDVAFGVSVSEETIVEALNSYRHYGNSLPG